MPGGDADEGEGLNDPRPLNFRNYPTPKIPILISDLTDDLTHVLGLGLLWFAGNRS